MEKIIDLHVNFYEEIMAEPEVTTIFERENIKVLDGFIQNIDLVRTYYQTFYETGSDRIVLCGINPGKLGAGKTGIPFLDFQSVSQLFSDIQLSDSERSAQFIWSVMNEIGIDDFYDHVYMTNISWFGFTKNGNNLNYYDLPGSLSETFTSSFITEMEIVKPSVIIPLSEKVEQTLKQMVNKGDLRYPIAERLAHPYFCSIGKNEPKYKQIYLEKISSFINVSSKF